MIREKVLVIKRKIQGKVRWEEEEEMSRAILFFWLGEVEVL